MESAEAFDKGSFIALTGNNEINLLAAQLAHDAFFIPKNIVLFAPQDDGAGVELLDRIKASSMFASKTELAPWIFKIRAGDFKEEIEEVKEVTTTRNWVKQHKLGKDKILPILIIDSEGKKRPFHYHDEIQPKEKVLYLR